MFFVFTQKLHQKSCFPTKSQSVLLGQDEQQVPRGEAHCLHPNLPLFWLCCLPDAQDLPKPARTDVVRLGTGLQALGNQQHHHQVCCTQLLVTVANVMSLN
jgi:hypothetical protein